MVPEEEVVPQVAVASPGQGVLQLQLVSLPVVVVEKEVVPQQQLMGLPL